MLLAEAGCVFVALLLYLSGSLGQASSICALKGSSVDLPCSVTHPTSSKKWYTVKWNGWKFVLREISVDRNRVMYDKSKESNSTLTIKDLRETDANTYSCRDATDNSEHNRSNETNLHVTDLQVKVIPVTATEGQRVTLICSTSCPLTENSTAYIWYKNGAFLYQDSSPWYQHLVSSEEAVSYSCAVKGHEDLRAPEVSVDSVTSTCFSVTYAEGRMCSSEQPCSITYPTELHVEVTPSATRSGQFVRVTCSTSCTLTDPKPFYTWFKNGNFEMYKDQFSTFSSSVDSYSCAVKGHNDLRSPAVCTEGKNCWSVNYVSRRNCALEGSSVDIYGDYSYPTGQSKPKFEYAIRKAGKVHPESLIQDARHVYHENMENHQHILKIANLTKSDSAEYAFRFLINDPERQHSGFPGVTLIVTALTVKVTPSAVMTEGQRVTLTCSTSCPLTDNTTYIWYQNRRPLTPPESQHKHLVLDPVSSQHAGNYSCAVKTLQHINSPEETLTVTGKSIAIMHAMRLTLVFLSPIALSVFYLWMRKKKTQTSTTESNDPVQTGQQTDSEYENISALAMNPVSAAQREAAEQQEDSV
ncbi:uncharacterized protein LOC139909263 isoform X1 [Centroberyx gerrardi]